MEIELADCSRSALEVCDTPDIDQTDRQVGHKTEALIGGQGVDQTDRGRSDGNHSAEAKPGSVEQRWAEQMSLTQSDHLPAIIVARNLNIERVGCDQAPVIVKVRAAQTVFGTDRVISSNREVVFMGRNGIVEQEDACVPSHSTVR